MKIDHYFRVAISAIASLTLVYQSQAQDNVAPKTTSSLKAESPPMRGLDANLYMQTSAEYRAVCYQTFQLAELRLREALAAAPKDDRRATVIMDLDETVLDNGGFQTWMLRTGRAYDQSWFDRWEQHGGEAVGLIAGAKEFIIAAESLGVRVVHISNRNERYRAFTKATLERLGIPIHDESELKLSTTTSDKTTRRAEVEADQKNRVLILVGDNLRDFDERFRAPALTENSSDADLAQAIRARKQVVDDNREKWGTQWIVLPNPAYGEWTKPLSRGLRDFSQLNHVHDSIGLAFWNVENLFDTVDDPDVEGDEEFTPAGPNRWTAERQNIKLGNLATVISRMHDGRGPDVLGLAEIENRDVVEALIQRLEPLGRQYKIVHKDSPSGRGIDCALIYDANVFNLESSEFHFVPAEDTRDIVEAKLVHNGLPISVFVNHWPSRSHDPSFRMKAAQVLAGRIAQILKDDPAADIIAMGDFNDYPDDPSITQGLNATWDPAIIDGNPLFNTSYAETPDASTGTYVYNDQWGILDQMIVSPGMLQPGGVSWSLGSTMPVVLADDQMFKPRGKNAIPRPSRSYTKSTFHKNGYSDHMPIVTTLLWPAE